MTHPDLVTMVLHGFLVQGASDLLMPYLCFNERPAKDATTEEA